MSETDPILRFVGGGLPGRARNTIERYQKKYGPFASWQEFRSMVMDTNELLMIPNCGRATLMQLRALVDRASVADAPPPDALFERVVLALLSGDGWQGIRTEDELLARAQKLTDGIRASRMKEGPT